MINHFRSEITENLTSTSHYFVKLRAYTRSEKNTSAQRRNVIQARRKEKKRESARERERGKNKRNRSRSCVWKDREVSSSACVCFLISSRNNSSLSLSLSAGRYTADEWCTCTTITSSSLLIFGGTHATHAQAHSFLIDAAVAAAAAAAPEGRGSKGSFGRARGRGK